MKYFSAKFTLFFLMGLCVMIGLAGCGKKEEAKTAVKESVAAPAASVEAVQDKGEAEKKEIPQPSSAPITEERTFYDFEAKDLDSWEIPLWALGKSDHVAIEIKPSNEFASHGESSMMVMSNFPGGAWTAALVEIQQYLDLSKYRVISADIYLPKDAPVGLKAKIILTVGENWKFVEMNLGVPLMPGEWATVTANIEPGSYDWKRVVPDETFAEDVRKIAIRIESNHKPIYSGPIYIDNVRVGR